MNKVLGVLLAAGLVGFWSVSARAAIVQYELNFEFSGATPPEGAAPWLRVVLDDGGGSGSVNMKMTALNLVGTEFVRFWMFNLDPALDPTQLVFSAPVKTGSFSDPLISLAVDGFQADGDGFFDIRFGFDQSPPANRFDASDAVEYTITGIASLTANSFNFFSAPGGGNGPWPTAAHVQGIGSSGQFSGWITHTPEPASLALALVALPLLGRRR